MLHQDLQHKKVNGSSNPQNPFTEGVPLNDRRDPQQADTQMSYTLLESLPAHESFKEARNTPKHPEPQPRPKPL